MPHVTVGAENDAPIEIHYADPRQRTADRADPWYPLNGNSWERQERELLAHGIE